jgi:hypothetical protein
MKRTGHTVLCWHWEVIGSLKDGNGMNFLVAAWRMDDRGEYGSRDAIEEATAKAQENDALCNGHGGKWINSR